MIKSYFNFQYYSLLESLLKVDPDFSNLIEEISDKDSVAKKLLGFINQDITTNVNYLRPAEKNDDVKFVNDTQVDRFIKLGQNPFERAINSAKVGRTVRQILTSNKVNVTDQEIEKFVNAYKNAWDKKLKKTAEGFHLVSGEEIRKWYLEDNYVPGGGTLNNSCMRYKESQEYLNIYTENPECCQLLILLDDRNKLLGRALLWKLKTGTGKKDYFLDRIYTRFDNDAEKFADWFRDFLKVKDDNFDAHFLKTLARLRVQLKKWKFGKYPYMDSFSILDYDTGVLLTFDGADTTRLQFHLQNTLGHPNVPNYNYSRSLGTWIHSSESVWIGSEDDYYTKGDCVKDYNGEWVLKSTSVYSDFYKGYLPKQDSIEMPEFGLVDKKDVITVYDDVVNGKPTKERKFLKSKVNRTNYERVEFGYSAIWVNVNLVFYDSINHEYVIETQDFNENYTKLHCIDSDEIDKLKKYLKIEKFENDEYGLQDSKIGSETPLVYELYNDFTGNTRYFTTKEIVDAFSLKVKTSEDRVVLKNFSLYRKYQKMCYETVVEIFNKFRDFNIQPLLDLLSKINDYCAERYSRYRDINSAYKIIGEYGSYTNFLNSIISSDFKKYGVVKMIENKSENVITSLENYIRGNPRNFDLRYGVDTIEIKDDENLRESIILFLDKFKEAIIYYAYFLIIFNDRDYADYRLEPYLRKHSLYDDSIITYFCRYEQISGKFAETINNIRTKISENYSIRRLMDEQDTSGFDNNFEKNEKIYNLFLSVLNKD